MIDAPDLKLENRRVQNVASTKARLRLVRCANSEETFCAPAGQTLDAYGQSATVGGERWHGGGLS